MTYLVAWFRDGILIRSTTCKSERSLNRIANSYNEYAQLWNSRFGKKKNIIGVCTGEELSKICTVHKGLPKHMPREKLLVQRAIRDLRNMPTKGLVQ